MRDFRCSLIIPIFNTESSILQRCLQSLPDADSGVEILLIDDGSKTETAEELEKYRAEHIFVYHQENKGVSSARNTGLEKARGKYILFLDSDDRVLDGFVTESIDFMEKNHLEVGVFDIKIMPSNRMEKTGYPENLVMSGRALATENSSIFQNFDLCYSVRFAFDRSFLEKNQIRFRVDMSISEDMVFNMQALSFASRAAALHKCFYEYWLDTENSATRVKYIPSYCHDLAIQYEESRKFIEGDLKLEKQLAAFYMDFLFYNLVRNQRAGGELCFTEYKKLCEMPMFRESMALLGANHPCENAKAQLFYRLRYKKFYRLPYWATK